MNYPFGSVGSAARSMLRVDLCHYINTFLAPGICHELLHRVAESGPVTYPLFNGYRGQHFLGRFSKSGIRRSRCRVARSLLPVELCLRVNTFLAATDDRVPEGGPMTYPFFNGNGADDFLPGTSLE